MTLELKLLCLNLVEQGSIGLMGAIDHLRWLLAEMKWHEDRYAEVRQEAADTFMVVQRAIMKELMKSYDATADQTVLSKFLNIFVLTKDSSTPMQSFFMRCKETNSEKYSLEDVKQIIDLWRQMSNNLILWSFWYFLNFLLDICLCFCRWKNILADCMSSRPAVSAVAVRWHLPTLRLFSLYECPSNIPLCYRDIPNLPRIIIKSTTYLINCWCLLDQADLAVASKILNEKVTKLLDIIFWLIEYKTWRDEHFYRAGLGRLLRCITSMIVKRANSVVIIKPLTHFLRKTVATAKRLFSLGYYRHVDKIVNVFPLLSRKEMGTFLDKLQDEMGKLSETGHHLHKHESVEEELEKIIRMEDNLLSLSREDAGIVLLPDYVNEVIDSLPSEATTSIPEVGIVTLLHRNKHHLPSLEWAQDILTLFDRAVEVEQTLEVVLK